MLNGGILQSAILAKNRKDGPKVVPSRCPKYLSKESVGRFGWLMFKSASNPFGSNLRRSVWRHQHLGNEIGLLDVKAKLEDLVLSQLLSNFRDGLFTLLSHTSFPLLPR
ncbi:hypothetical protein shn_12790 [Shinella sp. HZN7]|nr:hypothetical protein shn_12790 [Shinella sp. HZN7]